MGEVITKPTTKASVLEMHEGIKSDLAQCVAKINVYEDILRTNSIPNHKGPTTTEDIKKLIGEDF